MSVRKENYRKEKDMTTVFNEMTGYEFKTTFWDDFSIADVFGVNAVTDTFNRAFDEWKSDYIYLTELVIVLNWKIWAHFYAGNEKLARKYDELWRRASEYACDNLTGEELTYYLRETD